MNINMNNNINNNILQSLQLIQSQFQMINSQINNLIIQIQNMGVFPNTSMQINNMSFQIFNFGINMLNLGIQYTNPMFKYDLKEQIDNIINQLNNISNNDINNNMMNMNEIIYNNSFHNINFIKNGVSTLIICDGNITVGELINKYLIKIGRNDLINKEEIGLEFLFNAELINRFDKKNKKVDDLIKHTNADITVIETFNYH